MAKRHTLDHSSFSSIVIRLQELVAANSGADVFEEVFRLIVAKIYAETAGQSWPSCAERVNASRSAENLNAFLAKANSKWPDIIGEPVSSKLHPEHLVTCAEVLSGVKIADCGLDILDHAFEYLVSQNSKGSLGQFFTPRHIVDFCIRLVRPRRDELILDPACGSGAFLFHTFNQLRRGVNYRGENLWGFDFSSRAARVARAMMMLAGADKAHVTQLNSLAIRSPQTGLIGLDTSFGPTIDDTLAIHNVREGFDVIVTNPPFAGEIVDPQMLSSYSLSEGRSRIERDCLFLERCISLLKIGGRMAIVLPHNKFGGKQFVWLRQWLSLHARILGVVGLDRNAFAPHTHQKTNILICTRRETPLRSIPLSESIFFGISESSGRDSTGEDTLSQNPAHEGPELWRRVAHDLGEIESEFSEFITQQKLIF